MSWIRFKLVNLDKVLYASQPSPTWPVDALANQFIRREFASEKASSERRENKTHSTGGAKIKTHIPGKAKGSLIYLSGMLLHLDDKLINKIDATFINSIFEIMIGNFSRDNGRINCPRWFS